MNTDSTKISYYRIGEFAKYVQYKPSADSLVNDLKSEIKSLELLVSVKDEKISSYENTVIPALETQNRSKDERITNNNNVFKAKEEAYRSEIKTQKNKKWSWGAIGTLLGSIMGFVLALNI